MGFLLMHCRSFLTVAERRWSPELCERDQLAIVYHTIIAGDMASGGAAEAAPFCSSFPWENANPGDDYS